MTASAPDLTIEQAKVLMKAGLGKAELEFVSSITVPLYWIIRENGKLRVRNGSAFFLDAGEGSFGVTAAHVVSDWRKDCAEYDVVGCQLGRSLALDLDGSHKIIDLHDELDSATFRITPAEVAGLRKTVLTGHQKEWPPPPPQRDKGIYYCGFPGTERLWITPGAVSFGIAAGSGIATSVSDINVSSLIEREHLIEVMGTGIPPEDYNFGGISGGPMLTLVEHNGIRSWRLAGVIYQGSNPSAESEQAIAGLEIIKARRADFLKPNGQLDVARWSMMNASPGK